MPATVPPSTATSAILNRLSHRSSAIAAEDNGGPATATSEAPGRLGGSAAQVLSQARGKYQAARSRPLRGVGWSPAAPQPSGNTRSLAPEHPAMTDVRGHLRDRLAGSSGGPGGAGRARSAAVGPATIPVNRGHPQPAAEASRTSLPGRVAYAGQPARSAWAGAACRPARPPEP